MLTISLISVNFLTFYSGLKNDSVPETFELKHSIGSKENYFPVRYVKIFLVQSWGPSFNFCVWHIRLSGCNDQKIVQPSIEWLNMVRIFYFKYLRTPNNCKLPYYE